MGEKKKEEETKKFYVTVVGPQGPYIVTNVTATSPIAVPQAFDDFEKAKEKLLSMKGMEGMILQSVAIAKKPPIVFEEVA